jgi:hypothetical protein
MMIVEARDGEHDTAAPSGVAEWNNVLEAYGKTLEAQRTYLDAVSSGAAGAEPPAPFHMPTGLPPSPEGLRALIESLYTATLTVLAQHEGLLDRLERPRAGNAVARRTTSNTVSVLDRAL